MIYFIVYFLSFCFCLLSEKYYNKNRFYYNVFKFFAIFIPSIAAGIRAIGVGTDTVVYVQRNFINALKVNSLSLLIEGSKAEFFYLIINFIVAKLFSNIHVLLFFLEYLIIFFIYKSCEYNRKRVPVFLSYLFFMLVFYNKSFNLVRQFTAMGVILYGFKYVETKDIKKLIFIVVAAFLLHTSSIVSIIIYLMYFLISKKNGVLLELLLFLVLLVIMFNYKSIMLFLINSTSLIKSDYIKYLNSDKLEISFSYLLFNLVCVIIISFFRKSLYQRDRFNGYLSMISIFGLFLSLLCFKYNYMIRISYYFNYVNIILFPQIIFFFKPGNSRTFIVLLMICSLLLYNTIYYNIQGNDGTYPYKISFNYVS